MNPPDLSLILVAGARPNFIKLAPLIAAIRRHNADPGPDPKLRFRLVHTGQHYDWKMSQLFFQELKIPAPDVNLEVGSGSHAVQTARIMETFEPVCLETRPDWVVVVGDVNSTMACALVAAKLGIRTAHVEAGLRSFDRSMPEEINRIITDALADLLLTPSADADENLLAEGIPKSRIRRVGNIMIDSLVANLERARQSRMLEELGLRRKEFAYVTLHRPSNVDKPASLTIIMSALRRLGERMPVVFPVHPRTLNSIRSFGLEMNGCPGLHIIDPIGYYDSVKLTENAALILTDSGGLQEESTWLGTPCLTLRPNTERPVTITLGTNRLTSPERLDQDIQEVLYGRRRPRRVPELWDGHTSERVVRELIAAPREAQREHYPH